MSMKVEREQLEHRLRLAIQEYATNKKIHDKIAENLTKRNVSPGETYGILTQSPMYPLETMDINLLYALIKEFYKVTGSPVLNPANYFYDAEIELGDKWKRTKEEYYIDDLVFKPVLQVDHDQWITILSSQEVGRLYNSGRILYRPETQRGMIAVKSKDSIVYRIDYNIEQINDIAEKLLNGSYIPNTLTFNVLKDGKDEVVYNSEDSSIFIGKESEINVADGFHRSYALLKALAINPNLQYNWEIRISNWDVDKAQRFIYQEDHRTPLRKEYRESLNKTKYANIVVNELNQRSQNELQFKIATDENALKFGNAYVMFNTLSEAIDNTFNINSQREARKIADYLVDFFNELIGIYIDHFNDIKKSQKKYYITYSNMFYGYIALAGELYNKENWVDLLEKALAKADLSKSNVELKNLEISRSEMLPKNKERLISYFKNLL